jgi:hypothetical protein
MKVQRSSCGVCVCVNCTDGRVHSLPLLVRLLPAVAHVVGRITCLVSPKRSTALTCGPPDDEAMDHVRAVAGFPLALRRCMLPIPGLFQGAPPPAGALEGLGGLLVSVRKLLAAVGAHDHNPAHDPNPRPRPPHGRAGAADGLQAVAVLRGRQRRLRAGGGDGPDVAVPDHLAGGHGGGAAGRRAAAGGPAWT